MKQNLLGLLALLLPIIAFSAPFNFTLTWDAYPTQVNGQAIQNGVMHIQCRTGQNPFVEVGTSGLQGPANVTCNANPGDSVDFIVIPTATNFQTGPASGVASVSTPLQVLPAATGVRAVLSP